MLLALIFPWLALVTELAASPVTRLNEPARFTLDMVEMSGIYIFAVIALQPHPALVSADSEMADGTEPAEPLKYARSGLDSDAADRIERKLRTAIEIEGLYRRPLLTLRDVSDYTGVTQHRISQVLSSCIGKSFFEYVNDCRVREVQRRLRDELDVPVLTICS